MIPFFLVIYYDRYMGIVRISYMNRQLSTLVKNKVEGSIKDVMEKSGKSVGESMLTVEAIIVIDTSSSMEDRGHEDDALTRYDRALEQLAQLQYKMPGKILVAGFSDTVRYYLNGVPEFIANGTNLTQALEFVHDMDGLARIIVISDGYPDNSESALDVARRFKSKIDTIYVGPEDEKSGREFLQKLAQATGGISVLAREAYQLADQTILLLTGDKL